MTVSLARARLAAVAAAAAYPGALLTQIAHATLPAYRRGDTLTDTQIEHVAVAVEALAESGHDADSAGERIARHQHTGNERWRDELWAEVLRAANARPVPPAPAGA